MGKKFIDATTETYWRQRGEACDEKRLLVNKIFRGINPLKRAEKGEAETVPLGLTKKEIPRAEAVELRKKVLTQQIERLTELRTPKQTASIA
jgi:hypothetical protein